ncbi:hypothetical protein VP01_6439g1, partial [Puccinia sorghi]
RIIMGINVQHSCIGGKCQSIESKLASQSNQESATITWHINHSSNNSNILNGVSHHYPEHHRVISNIKIPPITDQMFEEALKKDIKQPDPNSQIKPQDTANQLYNLPLTYPMRQNISGLSPDRKMLISTPYSQTSDNSKIRVTRSTPSTYSIAASQILNNSKQPYIWTNSRHELYTRSPSTSLRPSPYVNK